MKVVSVNVGGASKLMYDGESLDTGIFKSPDEGPVFLTKTGFLGDVQVDSENHGGQTRRFAFTARTTFRCGESKQVHVRPRLFW